MTIFGFNTDVRHGDTVFHVQTEVHPNELTLRSAIFVRGRCIGKHSVSYAGVANTRAFDDQHVHELVTQQHRFVLNTIREGRIEALLAATVPDVAAPSASTPLPPRKMSQPAAPSPDKKAKAEPLLTLEWLPDSLIWQGKLVRMRLRVASGTEAVKGARILTRLESSACAPVYCEGVSDADGEIELVYEVPPSAHARDARCTVLAKVMFGDTSVIRKFRLQRS